MNDNVVEAIRSGLIQYIGAVMSTLDKEGNDAAHIAIAQLSEAWLLCCKKEDGSYDMFSAKPILRAAHILLEQRLNDMKEHLRQLGEEPQNSGIINDYEATVRTLKILIDTTKKGE